MINFNGNQVMFQTNDRGWKGVSVIMILNNSIYDPSVLSEDRPIYLCIGHFRSRKSAESLRDKLNAGEITPYDAAIKAMKRYIKWVNNPRGFGGGWCIGRDQLVYFGATASDLAQYDAAKATFTSRICETVGKAHLIRDAKQLVANGQIVTPNDVSKHFVPSEIALIADFLVSTFEQHKQDTELKLQVRLQHIRKECSTICAAKSGRDLEEDEGYRKLLKAATQLQADLLRLRNK